MKSHPTDNALIIRRSRRDWRIIWSAALLMIVLYDVLSINFLYLHYYLLIFGAIALAISIQKWVEADSNELIIYYGSFIERSSIRLGLEEILSIKNSTIRRKQSVSIGNYNTPIVSDFDYNAILIDYRRMQSETDSFPEYSSKKIQIDPKNGTIAILEKPEGGFDLAYNNISTFLDNRKNAKIEKPITKICCIDIFDIVLFLSTISAMLYMIFIK